MTDINNPTLYHMASTVDYPCSVKVVSPGMRIYNRNTQKVITTSDVLRFLVTGPAGEKQVYTEEEFNTLFDFPDDEKQKKKLMKGKLFKIKASSGTAKTFYLRVPAEERFTIYAKDGSVIQGNVADYSVDHGEGDCVICPAKEDGSPDLDDKSMMNGQVFKERYGV